jgi:hypothetical protein
MPASPSIYSRRATACFIVIINPCSLETYAPSGFHAGLEFAIGDDLEEFYVRHTPKDKLVEEKLRLI